MRFEVEAEKFEAIPNQFRIGLPDGDKSLTPAFDTIGARPESEHIRGY
jgi:hypothetical protein